MARRRVVDHRRLIWAGDRRLAWQRRTVESANARYRNWVLGTDLFLLLGFAAESQVCAGLSAGGEWIRKFSSAMPRHRHQRGRLHSNGEWWLLETSQQLYWFAEADDCSDDTAAPRVDRPQLGRSLETAAYLARNRKFESTPLSPPALRLLRT
jgi:hypothetical protein